MFLGKLSSVGISYWTNEDDEYSDTYEYELVDDSAIRKLIDKYYPDLSW